MWGTILLDIPILGFLPGTGQPGQGVQLLPQDWIYLPVQTVRKKLSPSIQRRNAKRRQEFLNKKQSPLSPSPTKPSTSTSSLSTPTRSSSFSSSSEAEKQQLEKPQTEKVFRCAYKRCNATFASREEQVNHGKDTAKIPWGVVKSMHSGPMRDAQEQGLDWFIL